MTIDFYGRSQSETVRKAVSFFVMICATAGIPLSNYLKSKPISSNGGTTRRYKKRRGQGGDVDGAPTSARGETLQDKLLAKFPEFDPAWDAEMQKKWFDTFEQFMKSVKAATDEVQK